MPYETDLHNVIQVARAEGMKLYKNPSKIKVADVLKCYPHGWIAVFQNAHATDAFPRTASDE
jgi:hypothetical protein